MKVPMVKTFFGLTAGLFFSVNVGLSAAPPPSGEFQLLISQGLNELDTGRNDQALKTFREALRIKPDSADAHFHIGHIHLRRGLTDVAKEQFEKAEKFQNNFLNGETKLNLYFQMAALYHALRYPDREAAQLHKLLKLATNEAFVDSPVYLQAAGKAFFALALLSRVGGKSIESKRAFLQSAAYDHRKKSCFLYLAHYYGSRTQDDIDAENRAYYRDRSPDGDAESFIYRKEHPGKSLKPDRRDFQFETFYRRYEETRSQDREEETFLIQPAQIKLIEEINRFMDVMDKEALAKAGSFTNQQPQKK